MIPVELQPEPADFDENVRRRGRSWLATHGVDPDAPPPGPKDLPTYWQGAAEWSPFVWHEARRQGLL